MSRCLMLHLDRNGDEPPARTRGNRCAHDFALETQCLAHVDIAQLRDSQRMLMNGELVVGQVEAQSITLLAFKVRKSCFLSILAWMFELRLRPFLFHAPVVGKRLPKIAKCLFWSALGHLIAPRELLALDLVVCRLDIFHLDPFARCTRFFPASKRPVISVAGNTASFAKVHILFWRRIQSDHMRAIHGLCFLERGVFEHFLVRSQTVESGAKHRDNSNQVPY